MQLQGQTKAQVDALALQNLGNSVLFTRQSWYRSVGDGIYLKEQRQEVPSGTWAQAVSDMKAANPWPSGYTSPTAAMLASLTALHNQLAGKSQVSP